MNTLHTPAWVALFGMILTAGPTALDATTNPVGGGLLHGGLVGTWFGDAGFTTEAFNRRDIRLDFDWGELRKPGGSLAWTRLGQLGTDNYSVRWQGQLMARFSETYTITAYADSVRLWIVPAGAAWGAPLIDYWPASDPVEYAPHTGSFAFIAGEPYDIKVEYRERTGPAMMRLLWESPSTPQEVIQPTAMVGEIPPQRGVILADAVHSATNWGENYGWGSTDPRKDGILETDADGWPAEDFSFILRPTDRTLHLGAYLLSFKGSARVNIGVGGGELFSADGSISHGTQTNATDGYDPATNTTTLRVVISNDTRDAFWPGFRDTDRDGPGDAYAVNSGLTDLRMLRPSGIYSDTPHGPDDLFAREAIAMLETFVTFRWNDVNGTSDANPDGASIGLWEHRRKWGPNTNNTSFTSENHEYKILLSNHTGRDLYIQVPHVATDDYITRLAQLIAYGADAEGAPYTGEVADPHFPPLNPNLRVNVEYANEIPWNSAGQYPQSAWARQQPEVLRQAWLADPDSPDGLRFQILNFDGALPVTSSAEGFFGGKRFSALRTVEISDIFRSVFGDDFMQAPGRQDPRVRVLYMYQYDNNNSTATDAFNFIDGYFNKVHPASTYPGEPKPVPHFIYGGGTATYYASADRFGALHDHPLVAEALGTFESPFIEPGPAIVAPAGSPWSFTGTAGIYREAQRSAGACGAIPAPTRSVDDFNYRGMKITVGPQDVAIYEVGRYVHEGNAGNTTIGIYDADAPHTSRFSRNFSLDNWPAGGTAWQRTGRNIFIISNKAYGFPIILQAGKSYYIVATESATGNTHSAETGFTPPPGVSVDGAALGRLVDGTWTWQTGGTPNRTYGPVNFKLAPAPISTDTGVNLGFLQDSKNGMESITSLDNRFFSPQAAFIAGQGGMEIDITFPAPGVYGLIYSLAHKPNQTPYAATATVGENRPMIHLLEDGAERNITPADQGSQLPSLTGWSHEGYWTKPNTGYDFFGSSPFEITDTSKTYRIRFTGTNVSTDRVVLIDNVILASADKMTEGQIPSGGGFAEGAPDVSNWEARVMSMYKYAQSFGLRAMSYEGGWYPGGDANKMPLQFASSFFAGAMLQGEMNAVNALNRAGLVVNTDYTLNFALPVHGISDPDAYRRIQAWKALNAGLPAEPTNGQPITSFFTAAEAWLSKDVSGATMGDGGWLAWNIIVPETGNYDFQLETSGTGTVSLRVNEAHVPVSGPAGGSLESAAPVFLTKGLHSMRVLTQGGNAALVALSVTGEGQLPGFNGLTGSAGNGEVYLSWPEFAGATGYHVYYKSRLASDFTRFTTTPVTTPDLAVTGLLNDITYNFVVSYVDGRGIESAYSNMVTVVPSEIAVVMAWDFDNSTDKQSQAEAGLLTPRARSPKLAAGSHFSVGPQRTIGSNGHYSQDALMFYDGWNTPPLPSTFDADHWAGFSVTPAPGVSMRLTLLEFGLWYNGSGAFNCELRVSTDGFATSTVVPLSPEVSSLVSTNGNSNTGQLMAADLSGVAALLNLADATSASFRIHFFGTDITYWGIGKLGDTIDDVILYRYPVDPAAPSAYTLWADSIAWADGDDPSPAGVANPAGVNNLVAYAINADPTDPAITRFLPTLHAESPPVGTPLLHLTTRRRTGDHGLLYQVLASANLQDWDPFTPAITLLDPDFDGDGATELVRYTVPMPHEGPDAGRLFLRLGLTLLE
jgi:hypothetical protein